MFPAPSVIRSLILSAVLSVGTNTFALPPKPPAHEPDPKSGGDSDQAQTDLVVVAPHPDDEVLLASGLILQAKQEGKRVAIIIMTNGDFDCQVDGLVREAESVAGLSELGVEEDDVYFLGYPDGHLARLGRAPLQPVARKIDGKCTRGNHTYGNRGSGRREFHRSNFGSHATYTAMQATDDLATLLQRLKPKRLAVTHPNDTHPDHAATYTLVRRALQHLPQTPELLRGLVHNGDCWPTGEGPNGQCLPGSAAPHEELPPLSGALSGYIPDVHAPVPQTCLATTLDDNPKWRAIAAHHTQTRDDQSSYLFSFTRANEAFFSEQLATGEQAVLLHARAPYLPSSRRANAESLEVLRASSGEYSLEVDVVALEVAVWRDTGVGQHLLHRWPLPHDTFARRNPTFALKVEHVLADGNAELGVYVANALVGVTAVLGGFTLPASSVQSRATTFQPAP